MKTETQPANGITFTQKELLNRWGCSLRTVQRDVRRYRLKPVAFRGIEPQFSELDVLAMERRRLEERSKQIGLDLPSEKILTVKEAKRRAGK